MSWSIEFYPAFETEFDKLPRATKTSILARAKLLEEFGPRLARPHADTLEGSRHANMKELRCSADDGVWRVAFAFDEERSAILLVAGDKSGMSQKRFYKKLITKADERFEKHLKKTKG